MAVIEIAKIQVRRGQANETGLPQLDSGEFGWAIDTQKLYIGNGSVAEGAPEIGNTEIITEHTVANIFDIDSLYYYRGYLEGATPVITGPGGNGNSTRTLRRKLDDNITVLDFGALGNNSTPDTEKIQQAIDQLYLNSDQSDARSRRRLSIPAGTYIITSTIYIPPYTTIVGDGPDKTILKLTSLGQGIMQTVDITSDIGLPVKLEYGQNNFSTVAKDVYIEGVTFCYDNGLGQSGLEPLLKLDCVEDAQIVNCKFQGYNTPLIIADDIYTGIDIRGQGAITSKNVTIRDCVFDGLKIGVRSNYDIEDIDIDKNKFTNLYSGIAFGLASSNNTGGWTESLVSGNNTGPIRGKITENLFSTIQYQAIVVGNNATDTPTYHKSLGNTFEEVGNNVLGDLEQSRPLIEFNSYGNLSRDDLFLRERFASDNALDDTGLVPSVQGRTFVESNVTYMTDIVTMTPTPEAILLTRLPYSGNDQVVKVQYIVYKTTDGVSRKGELSINVALAAYANVTDNFSYVGPNNGGVEFSAVLNTTYRQIRIYYTSTINSAGTIEYRYSSLQ